MTDIGPGLPIRYASLVLKQDRCGSIQKDFFHVVRSQPGSFLFLSDDPNSRSVWVEKAGFVELIRSRMYWGQVINTDNLEIFMISATISLLLRIDVNYLFTTLNFVRLLRKC